MNKDDNVFMRADRLDQNRQKQINNQIEIINGLKQKLLEERGASQVKSLVVCVLAEQIIKSGGSEVDAVIISRSLMEDAVSANLKIERGQDGEMIIKVSRDG